MSAIYAFANGHPLITIAQTILRVFLVQFGKISRELLHTLVFQTLGYYDVNIPGSELEMQ